MNLSWVRGDITSYLQTGVTGQGNSRDQHGPKSQEDAMLQTCSEKSGMPPSSQLQIRQLIIFKEGSKETRLFKEVFCDFCFVRESSFKQSLISSFLCAGRHCASLCSALHTKGTGQAQCEVGPCSTRVLWLTSSSQSMMERASSMEGEPKEK